jgi:predicted extracellular nuclease
LYYVDNVADGHLPQNFIKSLLAEDSAANIVLAGDFNEYAQTTSVFAPLKGVLTEIDEASNLKPVERYTYVYDQNSQQLPVDHMFLSDNIVGQGTEVEHVHVNTWAKSYSTQVSDYDSTVARVKIS